MDLPEGGAVVARASGSRRSGSSRRPRSWAGDEVAIVHFRLEGVHLTFLGDLGHSLDEAELAPIRGPDVALVAAGGPPTIDFPALGPLLEAIGPRLVVPMHYKTPGINLDDPAGRTGSSRPCPAGRSSMSGHELDRGPRPRIDAGFAGGSSRSSPSR